MAPDDETWSATSEVRGPDGELDPDADHGIEEVLGFELPAPVERSRRARLNVATATLAALVIAAGAFYAGVRVEKSHAKSSSTSNLAAAFSRLAGARGGATGARTGGTAGAGGAAGGAGGAGAAGAGVTVGTVKLVDGDNVYVTDTSGGITKVHVDSSATISVTAAGKVADVKPGDTVIVRGAAGSDGTVAATSVTDSGTGGAGGFGGFGAGGFGGGRGAAGATGGSGG
ncbi:MAG TPA: hypothetical protein VH914_05640 [Acidimicrobiia bacterium]|nr:hypothetical protein [Acidimicrobiia bacterium]